MLYRATMDSPPPPVPTYMREINVVTDGRIIQQRGIVDTAAQEELAKSEGWLPNPQAANDAATAAFEQQQEREREAANRDQFELMKQATVAALLETHLPSAAPSAAPQSAPVPVSAPLAGEAALAPDTSPTLTLKQAAERLGVHPDTVVNMHKKGEIELFKAGSQWRARGSEVERVRQTPESRFRLR